MSERYHAVMEKIEVTEAMRQRILANIGEMELSAVPRSKASRFPALRRLMPLAACLVLLMASVFALRQFMPGEVVEPIPSEGVMTGNGIVDVADVDALSEAVGFPVKGISALPFQADEVTYTSFWGELAQITYTGEGQTVTFRQSVGADDNSGDYTVYSETEVKEIGGLSVTLKGNGENYSLAVWRDGDYTYSARAEAGLTAAEWEAIFTGME